MRTNLVLLALAVVLGVFSYMTLQNEGTPMVDVERIPKLLPGFNPDNVGVVTIARRKAAPPNQAPPANQQPQYDQLVFLRTEEGWQLGHHPQLAGLPIKKDLVEQQILDHLQVIRLDRDALATATASKQYLQQRQLTEETALIITCGRDLESEPLAKVFKGVRAETLAKQRGAVEGYYVCRADNPQEVVIYDPPVAWEPSLDPNAWINKVVIEFAIGDVKSFVYNRPGILKSGFKLKEGSASTWEKVAEETSEDVGAARQGDVGELLQALYKVQAIDYLLPLAMIKKEDLAQRGLVPGKGAVEIRATLRGGTEHALQIGNPVQDQPAHYAIARHCDFLITVPSHLVNALKKTKLDLFDPPAAKKPPADKPPSKTPPKETGNKAAGKKDEEKKGDPDNAAEKTTAEKTTGEKTTAEKTGSEKTGGDKEPGAKKPDPKKVDGKKPDPKKADEKKKAASRKSGDG